MKCLYAKADLGGGGRGRGRGRGQCGQLFPPFKKRMCLSISYGLQLCTELQHYYS